MSEIITLQTADGLDLIIPMKASGTKKEILKSAIESDAWTCDFKLDGHAFIAYVNAKPFNGYTARIFSRNVSVKTDVFYERTEHLRVISEELKRRFQGYGPLILPGEVVHYLGKDTVTSVTGGNPEHAWKQQQELGYPVFCPFDILMYGGDYITNCDLKSRKELLLSMCEVEDIDLITDKEELKDPQERDVIRLVPTIEIMEKELGFAISKKELYDYSLKHGFEGLVHKRLKSIYQSGYVSNDKVRLRCSKDWLKQKVKREYDVVIMKFTEANFGVTGQFEGMVGAAVFGQYKGGKLTEIGQASGFDVATRMNMTDNPNKYIGKVALIEAQERSSARDRLRHAQFKGLRIDKNPEDCIYDEDEC
jgi:ATP-dependent DNA ligase